MKDYLLRFLTTAAPENACGQDALEWAVYTGLLRLTCDLDTDVHQAMQQYGVILEGYHHTIRAGQTVDEVVAHLIAA